MVLLQSTHGVCVRECIYIYAAAAERGAFAELNAQGAGWRRSSETLGAHMELCCTQGC